MTRILIASFLFLICCMSLAWGQEQSPPLLEVPPGSIQSQLIKRVAPVYPPLARQARIQGTVVLQIVINKSGEVSDVKLVSGHPLLAPAAIEAVKQWRYRPYEKDGAPVDVKSTVQVNFTLADNRPGGVIGDAPPGSSPVQPVGNEVHVCDTAESGSLPQRVRVSSGVMQGLLLEKKNPIYPEEARSQRIQGTVLLAMEIGKDGIVCDLALISGHPLLAPAAIDAVRQWKYRPYLLNGEPVEVESQAQINFTLTPRPQ